jgi:hypothetical protein
MSNGDLNWIANFIWGSLPDITELEPIDDLTEGDDLDDAENDEVAA